METSMVAVYCWEHNCFEMLFSMYWPVVFLAYDPKDTLPMSNCRILQHLYGYVCSIYIYIYITQAIIVCDQRNWSTLVVMGVSINLINNNTNEIAYIKVVKFKTF